MQAGSGLCSSVLGSASATFSPSSPLPLGSTKHTRGRGQGGLGSGHIRLQAKLITHTHTHTHTPPQPLPPPHTSEGSTTFSRYLLKTENSCILVLSRWCCSRRAPISCLTLASSRTRCLFSSRSLLAFFRARIRFWSFSWGGGDGKRGGGARHTLVLPFPGEALAPLLETLGVQA